MEITSATSVSTQVSSGLCYNVTLVDKLNYD